MLHNYCHFHPHRNVIKYYIGKYLENCAYTYSHAYPRDERKKLNGFNMNITLKVATKYYNSCSSWSFSTYFYAHYNDAIIIVSNSIMIFSTLYFSTNTNAAAAAFAVDVAVGVAFVGTKTH